MVALLDTQEVIFGIWHFCKRMRTVKSKIGDFFSPESILRNEDNACSQIGALQRQNFAHEDERDVAVAHRELDVDQHDQHERGPTEPAIAKKCLNGPTQASLLTFFVHFNKNLAQKLQT